MAIPVTKPSIKRRDMDAVLTCMVSDSLGPGTISRSLCAEVAKYLDLPGGFAFREYHRAVDVACEALDLGRGARILVSPLSSAVYYRVFDERGIEMVFADVEESSPCLSMRTIGALGRSEYNAVVVDSTLGFSPDLRELRDGGARIIEDISHGLGGHNGRERNGALGDCVVLAVEADGIITAGGGAIVLAGSRKTHGALKSISGAFGQELFLPDMNSALGLTQIREVETFLSRRREIAQILSRAMMRSPHRVPAQPGDGENVHYSFPVLLKSGMREVAAYARKNGIETVPAFANSILGRELPPEEADRGELTNAKAFLLRCLLFPLYPTLTKKDTELIARVLTTLP